VSLSDAERAIIAAAGTAPLQTARGQAVAIVLAKQGRDREVARALLAESYLAATQPSFHLIPRGEAMTPEADFVSAYTVLAEETSDFTDVSAITLSTALDREPSTLAPLRMILGFTTSELAIAIRLVDPSRGVTGSRLKNFERRARPAGAASGARSSLIAAVAETVLALMDRRVLTVPEGSEEVFHSKLDKRDTRDGWTTVAADAQGVPYSALLYQRYVGGVWRQVQDAYSEAKGDALLEKPVASLLEREQIPFYRSRTGASGAVETAQTFGIAPGPDFLLPAESPTVVIETKIGEDGGTVRDKAARIGRLAAAASTRVLLTCAVIDGKGWRERPNALVDVVIATGGRTYSLKTLEQLLGVPEITALQGTA
jgi:hypothetical protein